MQVFMKDCRIEFCNFLAESLPAVVLQSVQTSCCIFKLQNLVVAGTAYLVQ